MSLKTGIEILPAAFTDHHAVVVRVATPQFEERRARTRWKMDPILAQDEHICSRIKRESGQRAHPQAFLPERSLMVGATLENTPQTHL